VFVLADSPWPATSGGQMRNVQLHRALTKSSEVRVVIFRMREPVDRDAIPDRSSVVEEPLPARGLKRVALRARGLLRRRHPFLQHLSESGAPDELARMLAHEPADAVVLTYPCLGPFIGAARRSGARVLVDLGEARTPIARRRLGDSRRPGAFLRAFGDFLVARGMERGAARADEVWVASPAEEKWLPAEATRHLRVVPNTIEVDSYLRRPVPVQLPHSVGYVGSFDYPPNAIAASRLIHRILPILRAADQEARAILIGRQPPAGLVEESRAATDWELRANVANPLDDLAEAGILVVPLTAGGGTKYKILEAAASGIPIVTTTLGLQGIALKPGEDVLVADTDDEIAAAAMSLWADPSHAARLADNAFAGVRAAYGPAALDAIVEASLDSVLGLRAA
jgi:polysaccharide biosynthesis protein PslH